ncbi:MAG: protoporphyrinogen oxidase HemJ [Hyphomicrobiaceae bacterium]|nr:protoporphyrinogen oxidase HemJ [Hyphomicrobiaceae bacterium]
MAPAAEFKAGSPARRAFIALAVTVAATAIVIALFGRDAYDWVKAVHVIAIIAWMAGLLYLPRLFVYHADVPQGSAQAELFKLMEFRLLTIIMTPAMIVAWVLGLWLAWQGGWFSAHWFYAKLAAVIALSGVHGMLSAAVRRFADDRNEKSARYWRMMNEVPTLLMFAIVILVIVKPF